MDLLIPLALAALLIFFLFNSRRKQKARAEQIKSGLVPGASVMTTFGVFGTVVSIDEEKNQVTIESAPGTVLRVHRQAIGQIENPEAAAPVDAPVAEPAPDDADASSAETDDEKPAITDAELDAMNARKRAEKDADEAADSEDSELADSADDAAESTDASVESTDADELGEITDDAETDSDVDDSESSESDTDNKN